MKTKLFVNIILLISSLSYAQTDAEQALYCQDPEIELFATVFFENGIPTDARMAGMEMLDPKQLGSGACRETAPEQYSCVIGDKRNYYTVTVNAVTSFFSRRPTVYLTGTNVMGTTEPTKMKCQFKK